MPEEDEAQQPEKASVDDLAATLSLKLKEYKEEDALLAEEETTIKKRRALLKVEITKAERMTRSLLPRAQRAKKPTEVNPPVEQPVVQTEPVQQAVQAPPFKPE